MRLYDLARKESDEATGRTAFALKQLADWMYNEDLERSVICDQDGLISFRSKSVRLSKFLSRAIDDGLTIYPQEVDLICTYLGDKIKPRSFRCELVTGNAVTHRFATSKWFNCMYNRPQATFYGSAPGVINLAVLSENGKEIGGMLVWHTLAGQYLHDRPYHKGDRAGENFLLQFAAENGWLDAREHKGEVLVDDVGWYPYIDNFCFATKQGDKIRLANYRVTKTIDSTTNVNPWSDRVERDTTKYTYTEKGWVEK